MTTAARARWRVDPGGVLLGIVAVALSLTPSLLPRPAVLQGVISGVAFSIGYALGVVLTAVVVAILHRRSSPPSRRSSRWPALVVGVVAVLGLVAVAIAAVGWQNEVRGLVEVAPIDGVDTLSFVAGLVVTTAVLLLVGWAVRRMRRDFADRMAGRRSPLTISVLASLATAGVVVGTLALLVGGAMVAVDRIWWDMNGAPSAGTDRTLDRFRSGSPQSSVDWNDLGRHGADFVASGPTAADIETATGLPALDPIRVYVGIASAPTLAERAAIAVEELERTGAFDRGVLAVVATTGSGWIEPQTVDSLEYLVGGDSAIVGIQFAYTPSWVSSIFDADLPDEAAEALFTAVEARWRELPEERRPRLVVQGLSLGAQALQNTFTTVDELRQRTDGALLIGSPGTVAMWRGLQDSRAPESPAWQPVVDDGAVVRWASLPGDLDALPGPWETPRVVFLQHATDPVTWLQPELLWSSPDWLEPDQRGDDVSSSMRWIPVITWVQVAVDMLMGQAVPARHGHNFGDVMVHGWIGVLGDPGLPPSAIAEIEGRIAQLAPIPPFLE